MEIRDSTKRAYLQFLKIVASQTADFNIKTFTSDSRVDVKLQQFLVKEKYVIRVSGDTVNLNPSMLLIPEHVVEDFIKWRNKVNDDYQQKKKGILQPSLNLTAQPQHQDPYIQKMIDRAVDEAKRKMAKEAAEYTEWAVQKGKSNIAEVVFKLLSV